MVNLKPINARISIGWFLFFICLVSVKGAFAEIGEICSPHDPYRTLQEQKMLLILDASERFDDQAAWSIGKKDGESNSKVIAYRTSGEKGFSFFIEEGFLCLRVR